MLVDAGVQARGGGVGDDVRQIFSDGRLAPRRREAGVVLGTQLHEAADRARVHAGGREEHGVVAVGVRELEQVLDRVVHALQVLRREAVAIAQEAAGDAFDADVAVALAEWRLGRARRRRCRRESVGSGHGGRHEEGRGCLRMCNRGTEEKKVARALLCSTKFQRKYEARGKCVDVASTRVCTYNS